MKNCLRRETKIKIDASILDVSCGDKTLPDSQASRRWRDSTGVEQDDLGFKSCANKLNGCLDDV